tara:strand:+ start:2108 stop:2347 length:240 start_codon:yes stop_codon:yes gene_type:complete
MKLGGARCTENSLHHELIFQFHGVTMHNIRSQNQLAEWKHLKTDYCLTTPQEELIDDYFACIVNSNSKAEEKICQELLC